MICKHGLMVGHQTEKITLFTPKQKKKQKKRPKKIKDKVERFKKISKISIKFRNRCKKNKKKLTKKDMVDSQRLAFFLNSTTSKVLKS